MVALGWAFDQAIPLLQIHGLWRHEHLYSYQTLPKLNAKATF